MTLFLTILSLIDPLCSEEDTDLVVDEYPDIEKTVNHFRAILRDCEMRSSTALAEIYYELLSHSKKFSLNIPSL